MLREILVGALRLRLISSSIANAIPMSGGESIPAQQHFAFITGPDGIALETAYLEFENDSRDVRVIETGDTPNPYLRLGHGGRLGIYRSGDSLFCELRAMKLDPENWSNLQRSSVEEIQNWLGEDLDLFLESIEATPIQTREKLFGDQSRRRSELAVGFEIGNLIAPLALYALTRPLPLLKGAKK